MLWRLAAIPGSGLPRPTQSRVMARISSDRVVHVFGRSPWRRASSRFLAGAAFAGPPLAGARPRWQPAVGSAATASILVGGHHGGDHEVAVDHRP